MKRRDFLKTSALAGAAMTLNFKELQAALLNHEIAVEKVPDLVAVMGGEPAVMLDKALEALGGIERFVKKGQKIVIKPNIGWDKTPEYAGNTNPLLIESLVKKCLAAGAEKVTVFDHTCDNWQKCYESSGIKDAVSRAGGVMMPGNEERYFTEVSLPEGTNLKTAKIHQSLIEADAWINVPVLKNHSGAKMTCAMKNHMGIVWDRRFFHKNDLHQCISDICTWEKRPVLNIVDAYRVLFRNGPQGKTLQDTVKIKSLIASTDIVAADTAALRLFNQITTLDLAAVSHIGDGEKHHLGTTDLKKLTIKQIKL